MDPCFIEYRRANKDISSTADNSEEKPLMALKLIEYGANTDIFDDKNRSLLFHARNTQLIETLIQKGLDVNAKDTDGMTPVQYMGNQIKWEFIKTLIKHGAQTEQLSLFDLTVMTSPDLVKIVLKNGANVNEVRDNKLTSLRCASWNVGYDYVGVLTTMEILLQNGADINYQGDLDGRTALHATFASIMYSMHYNSDNIGAIYLLIKHGAKPLKDKEGRTPLMMLNKEWLGYSRYGDPYDYLNPYDKRYDVIRYRFHKFEADYYEVPAQTYLKMLDNLSKTKYDSISVDKFWKKIDQLKKSSSKVD